MAPKPQFPSRGQKAPNFWDDDLQRYIDHGTTLEVVSGGSVTLPEYEPDVAQAPVLGYLVTSNTTIGGTEYAPGVYVFWADPSVYGGWSVALIDGQQVVPNPEAVPPVVGTLAASDINETGYTLTVTGASDAVALAALPYSFSLNNGTTWSAYQSSAVYVVTGRSTGVSDQARHRVRDAAGNVSIGTAITVTPVLPSITENFNRPDGTVLNGLTTTTGGKTIISPARSFRAGNDNVSAVVTGNKMMNTGGVNKGRQMAILMDAQDYIVSFDYVLDGGYAEAQVRIGARMNEPDNDASTDGLVIALKGNGVIERDSPTTAGIFSGSVPLSGNLALRCEGDTFTVYVDGVQKGTPFTIAGLDGLYVGGCGYYLNSGIDNFKVEYL